MGRRSDHTREELKNLAIMAATEIIDQEGYQALTARKLASKIGYTVGTLYLVFQNIDDLIVQLNLRTMDLLYDNLTQAMARCQSPESGLLTLGRTYIAFAKQHPHRWSLLFEHRRKEKDELPDWYVEQAQKPFVLVEQWLKALQPSRSQQDVQIAAQALWGSVHGIAILALTDRLGIRSAGSANDLLDNLMESFIKGYEIYQEPLVSRFGS